MTRRGLVAIVAAAAALPFPQSNGFVVGELTRDPWSQKMCCFSVPAASQTNDDVPLNLDRSTSPFRGLQYGALNNSTIPTAKEAANALGVRPPLEAPASVWKRAWNLQKRALPVLHLFDANEPPDSKLSLACLWWKALSANDPESPVFDNSLSYDMLPGISRILVGKKLRRFYPRLHHANVEIRTAFLDRSVTRIAQRAKEDPSTKVRLISLGAGYDVRSIKLRERGVIDQAFELDLPHVLSAKKRILHSQRFQRRRPALVNNDLLPTFLPVDLNDVDKVQSILEEIINLNSTTSEFRWHTILLSEAVMIYLKEDVPDALLGVCRRALETTGQTGSLCFADRLENIPGGDVDIGRQVLARHGWNITDWQPKPGLARHMGCAEQMMIPGKK